MKTKLLFIGVFTLLLALALLILWNGAPTIALTGALDGKSFVGEFGQKGKKAEGKDELIFKDGKFHSKACDPYGFGDGVYTTTVSGDTTTFETETESAKEGKIKWMGTVKGDTLDGTFTWYKGSKAPKEYWIKTQLEK